MGRKRNIFVREFFRIDNDKNESTCKACEFKLEGSHLTNLKRHMVKHHLDIYIEEREKFDEEPKEENIRDKKKSFPVKFSAEEVTNACVDFVTKESQPFSLFDSKAFKLLTEQIFKGLNIPVINSNNIMGYVSEKYEFLRNEINRSCKGRLISLKIDTATRHDRAILGINIQMIHNTEIKIYTLAMIELHERHTADYLKQEIENVLKEFDVKHNQIYTITTDNGRNMVKAVELFSSESLTELEKDEQFLETKTHEQSVETLAENFCSKQNTISVKCAAHTLQLAIRDFFTENKIAGLDRVREVVKTLRTPTFRYSLEHLGLKKPRMDVSTRWNSTYDMLHRLLEHKEFCQKNLKHPVALSKEEWNTIEDLAKVLTPLNEATLKLQKSQLFFGDFYILWLNLKLKLKTMTSNAAGLILNHIEARESQLLKNDAINAAIFLDPRLKRLLPADQKAKAKKHLKIIAAQMLSLKQSDRAIDKLAEATCKENDARPNTSGTSVSLLQKTINEMEVDSSSDDDTEATTSKELEKIYAEIDSYKEKRVDVEVEIMAYWQDKKYIMPYVSKLATICHAVPATQVSVERAFSALKLMLDDRRCNLSEQNLHKLLFVKLNTDFRP